MKKLKQCQWKFWNEEENTSEGLDRCDGYGASVTDDVLPRAAFFFLRMEARSAKIHVVIL